eukprot:NODE_740_length_1816_cov_20.557442_g602_i0.p1 GENE.NODE_740_length_1816_cov_20.557442_g602_i0~~NODE_740_length_1816_cov_20.557442_g602_i0.p1  ORF type:complete len:374 (+),score=124.46 NODE_740_length_1816_cov_20.557442_g602_i0:516-1637(+)
MSHVPDTSSELRISLPSLDFLSSQHLVSVQSTVHNTHLHNALVAVVKSVEELAGFINQAKAQIAHVSVHVEKQDQAVDNMTRRMENLDFDLNNLHSSCEGNSSAIRWCQNEIGTISEKQQRDTKDLHNRLIEVVSMVAKLDQGLSQIRDVVHPLTVKMDDVERDGEQMRSTLSWCQDELRRLKDRLDGEWSKTDSRITALSQVVMQNEDRLKDLRVEMTELVDTNRKGNKHCLDQLDARLDEQLQKMNSELTNILEQIRNADRRIHAVSDDVGTLAHGQRELRDALKKLEDTCKERQRRSHAELNNVLKAFAASNDEKIGEIIRSVQGTESKRTLMAAQIKAAGKLLHQLNAEETTTTTTYSAAYTGNLEVSR